MTTQSQPGFFEGIWEAAKAEVEKLEAPVVAEAKVLWAEVEADFSDLWKAAMPIAIRAVIAEAPKVVSGQEKFSSAVTHVYQQLEAAGGIDAAMQDVRTIVQEAYRWLPSLLKFL